MKESKWSYKKSVARAMIAIARWRRITSEVEQLLREEKKQLAKQKGQSKNRFADDFVPSWKEYCTQTMMPGFLECYVHEREKSISSINAALAGDIPYKAKKRRA